MALAKGIWRDCSTNALRITEREIPRRKFFRGKREVDGIPPKSLLTGFIKHKGSITNGCKRKRGQTTEEREYKGLGVAFTATGRCIISLKGEAFGGAWLGTESLAPSRRS